MPVVRKRQREDGGKTNEQVKRRKKCKEYTEFENIGYKDDHWHTTFRGLPENISEVMRVLSRNIGSFINGDGGILCFGVRKTGVIYGDEISRKEEDNLKLIIDEIFKKMNPHVPTDTYRVTFTPVLGTSFRRRDGRKEATKLQVLEIRIAPGDPFSLYEDQNHEVYLRKRDQPYGPLTPHEIKRHTVQQLTRQLKSHKDFAKLFEKPEKSKEKEKENSSVIANNKKSSSGSLSPTKKSSLKSNHSSPSKTSKLSTKVTQTPEKSSRSLRLRSKAKQSSELVPSKIQMSSKVKAVSGSKEHPIVLSSGESDHEAPLPSIRSQTRTSEPNKNTVEQPVEKPKATIKPFQIKKKSLEPIITRSKCLGEQPEEDEVAPTQMKASSLPLVEEQPTRPVKFSEPTISQVKCQRVAPAQRKASSLPLVEEQPTRPVKFSEPTISQVKCQRVAPAQRKASSLPLIEKQPTKLTSKPPPVQKTTITLPKQSSAKPSTKKVISPIVGPSAIPPPPRPPPSFSYHSHLQTQPRYTQSYDYCHSSQTHPYQYQSYNYLHRNYPVVGASSSSYAAHPLATSYSAPYYQSYH